MLAVGHDELIVGDDEDARQRLPRDGACAGGRGSSCLHDTTRLVGSGIPGKWDYCRPHVPRCFVIPIFMAIFVFCSLRQFQ